MLERFRRDDLVSMEHLGELLHKLNFKPAIFESDNRKKEYTWLVVALVTLGLVISGLVVYKLFFSNADDFDDEEGFEEDFEDIDYDEDFDDDDDFAEADALQD
ncbi:hypothetical protein [Anaerotalea alkaliphila]|uniref:DUF4366 domain-containing protein n=1 Tax=Anaerotalea alkaliphila TaxID=2662126 RepID=A0A7X5HU22_9FIRM|nr:hypothetical protein [Anaerotalea alkaliphila]NDL66668.1 hypothetical protein [Anaerotalea alkaliphila]